MFRKTHKRDQNGTNGPDMCPVCGAKEAPNSKCKSSEEMRASFEIFNTTVSVTIRKKTVLFSMDTKKLYPSLRKKVCKKKAVK